MKANCWMGTRHLEVRDVPDPSILNARDAIVRVTNTAICGSDLHLYEELPPFMRHGDILGHEPMGIVEAVGAHVPNLAPGDRVVIPFQIACGACWMCTRGLQTQCETTQVREHGMGAALFGYSILYGAVPGGQAEYLRVPQAHYGPIKVPHGPPDDRFIYLSDVLPTAWQAVQYAAIPDGGSVAVLGLGPIGQFSARIARFLGFRVIAADLVPERLELARRHGIEVIDTREHDDVAAVIRDMTDGRGTDSVIDAVGMEAHGAPGTKLVQTVTGFLPDAVERKVMKKMGVDRLTALHVAIDAVRRGGTISLIGVYGGQADPLPMLTLFDKQIQLRMGQANVRRWTDEVLPLLVEGDPLGVDSFATHRLPLSDAPRGYDIFQKKADGAIKVLLEP